MPTLADFLARALPWPIPGQTRVVNLHWRSWKSQGVTGSKPFSTLEDLLSYVDWAQKAGATYIRELYYCTSLQRDVGEVRKTANGIVHDPVTTDITRILRPPGTFNNKGRDDGLPPKPVVLKLLAPEDIDFAAWASLNAIKPPENTNLGMVQPRPAISAAELFVDPAEASKPPSRLITDSLKPEDWIGQTIDPAPVFQCPMFKHTLDANGAEVGQPLWNQQALACTFLTGGEELFHELSKGHHTYTYGDAEAMFARKVAERVKHKFGYPLCATFEREGSKQCATCPLRGTIRSPLSLRSAAAKFDPAREDNSSTPTHGAATASKPDDTTGSQKQPDRVSLDDFYAYMPMHNYIFAPSREPWPASSINSRLAEMPLFGADGRPLLDGSGRQKKIAASIWLDQNRAVEQMTWAPGLPMVIRDRLISEGGWIERPKVSCFNLYRPPIIVPGNAAEAERWLAHVHKVFGGDADHIVKWLAHRAQHPQEKINHALVFGGRQGIGKDTLLEPVKYAVGPWNFVEVSPQQMLGRFNGFLKSVVLRVNEARDLGETNRFGFYDHLKAYTAAPPDVLRVDEKNLREHSILNCCGVIITTNHKTDGIYLPADDRRHFVAWSELTKDDFVADYWNGLWDWYARGGYQHVAAYLAELDISSFDAKAACPLLFGLRNIILATFQIFAFSHRLGHKQK